MKNSRGFTLIEIFLVMAISVLLMSIATINLTALQNNTNLTSNLNVFISDMNQQQVKAMNGDTEGREESDSYGIYFLETEYVLFHGNVYTPSEPTNIIIPLETNIKFVDIHLPNNSIIFTKLSGEVYSFDSQSNTVSIQSTNTQEKKTIKFNKYGVITEIN